MLYIHTWQTTGKPGQVYHPIEVKGVPRPGVKDGDGRVLVKLYAAGLNHREIWLRKCEWHEFAQTSAYRHNKSWSTSESC